jgi:hypothetical protein
MTLVSQRPAEPRLRRAAHLARTAGRLLVLDFVRGVRVAVKPVGPIAYPNVDLTQRDPIPAILAAPEFPETVSWFTVNPAAQRSLVSPDTQALLFSMVRNLKPAHVFEIGTFRCGTTEAICRALLANGGGTLHTVDPYGYGSVPGILLKWPKELRRHVRYYPVNSMTFYARMARLGVAPALAFIDGNHDYEFALFDLHSAARKLAPGGFIFLDNVGQAGPFFAAVDFLSHRQGWYECGSTLTRYRFSHPFDRERSTINNTDLVAMRAPSLVTIGPRPETVGQQLVGGGGISGLRLQIREPSGLGTLTAQCIVRGFGARHIEMEDETSVAINNVSGALDIRFEKPIALNASEFDHITVETWLAWNGNTSLLLDKAPEVFW